MLSNLIPTLILISIVVAFCVFVYRKALGKQETIELYESITRIVFSEILLTIWILGCLILAVLIIIQLPKVLSHSNSILNVIPSVLWAISFMYPLLYIFYRYFTLDKFYYSKHKIDSDLGPIPSHRCLLEELSDELNIKNPPSIRYSSSHDSPSFIYGKNARKTTMVLPTNFDRLTAFVSQGNKETEEALKRFIFLHELAHIKNGDVRFGSFAIPLFKGMNFWLALVLLSGIFHLILSGKLSGGFSFGLLSFVSLLGVYVFAYILVGSTQRVREYLADTRAWLYFPDWMMRRLLTKSQATWASHLSVFELYLSFLRSPIRRKSRLSKVNKQLIKTIKKLRKNIAGGVLNRLVNYISLLHPSSHQRIKNLKEQQYLDLGQKYPSQESATFAGLGYTLWTITCMSLGIIIAKVLESSVALPEDLLTKIGTEVIIVAGLVCGLIFPAVLFTLPIINSSNQKIKYKDISGISGRLLISCLSAFAPGLAYFSFIASIQGPFLILAIYFIATAFIILLSLTIAAGTKRSITFFYHAGFSLIEYILTLIPGFSLLLAYVGVLTAKGVVSSWLEFSVIAALWIPSYLLIFFFSRIRPVYIDVLDSEMVWIRVGNKEIYLQAGKAILIAIIAIHNLMLIVPPILLHHFLSPLFEISGILIAVSIPVFGLILYAFFHERVRHPLPWNLYGVIAVSSKYLSLNTRHKDKIRRIILSGKYKDGGFILTLRPRKRAKKVGDMEHTFYAVKILKVISHCGQNLKDTRDWVLSCECENGGFANHYQGKPRLSSTYYALDILSDLNCLDMVSTYQHRDWITQCRVGNEGFTSPSFPHSRLADIFFAISSLEILGHNLTEIDLSASVRKMWRESRKTVHGTYYALSTIQKLGILNDEFGEELQKAWYPLYKREMINSRPDSRWEDVLLFFKISTRLNIPFPDKLIRKVEKSGKSTIEGLKI